MLINNKFFKKIFSLYALFFLAYSQIGCTENKSKEDLPKDAISKEINLAFIFVSLPENFKDESNKLSSDAKQLFSGLVGIESKCNFGYVLKPILVRADIDATVSIATKIEKSGIAQKTPIRDFKLVKQHLDEVSYSDKLLSPVASKSDSLFNNYLASKIDSDSLIIFSNKKGIDSIEVNGKWHHTYSDIAAIRNKMQSILCNNSDASIALLINPPSISVEKTRLTLKVEPNCQMGKITIIAIGGDGSPITYSAQGLSTGQSSNVFTLSKNQLKGVTFMFVAKQGTGSSTVKYATNCPLPPLPIRGGGRGKGLRDNGDLAIIKGSEGCEICTRYYSATDNLGRTRQVTQKNSTECCPCGKTIEMKGRTYRMECDGNSNRLSLVE